MAFFRFNRLPRSPHIDLWNPSLSDGEYVLRLRALIALDDDDVGGRVRLAQSRHPLIFHWRFTLRGDPEDWQEERRRTVKRMVGVITHVGQLAERIPDGLTIEGTARQAALIPMTTRFKLSASSRSRRC